MSPRPRRQPPVLFTPLSRHVDQPYINLILTVHTTTAIEAILLVGNPTHITAQVNLEHPTIPLTLDHMCHLRAYMYLLNNTSISFRIIHHHLLLSANSPLVPRDRSISLTIDNNIHSLTPLGPIDQQQRYHLHLFVNPYNRSLYLLYTFAGGQHNHHTVAPQHLTITTSLPSSLIHSKRPRRQHTMRTTFHTPHLGTFLTFPAKYVQHQMTILTLTTHMLLSILVINTPHMVWNIVRSLQT